MKLIESADDKIQIGNQLYDLVREKIELRIVYDINKPIKTL